MLFQKMLSILGVIVAILCVLLAFSPMMLGPVFWIVCFFAGVGACIIGHGKFGVKIAIGVVLILIAAKICNVLIERDYIFRPLHIIDYTIGAIIFVASWSTFKFRRRF
jgi:hypothetical protein